MMQLTMAAKYYSRALRGSCWTLIMARTHSLLRLIRPQVAYVSVLELDQRRSIKLSVWLKRIRVVLATDRSQRSRTMRLVTVSVRSVMSTVRQQVDRDV